MQAGDLVPLPLRAPGGPGVGRARQRRDARVDDAAEAAAGAAVPRQTVGVCAGGDGVHPGRGGAHGAVEGSGRRAPGGSGGRDVRGGQEEEAVLPQTAIAADGRPVMQPAKARLALWLLMIRSRLQQLGRQIIQGRSHHPTGCVIRRPHSPVDTVLRVWMEGVATDASAAERVLLQMLIDLLLHEAQTQRDYRGLFPFLIARINVHVLRLLQQTGPVVVCDVVFAAAR